MMKKLFKIATIFSLAACLSSAPFVYASEPPSGEENDDPTLVDVNNVSTSDNDINAKFELKGKTRYAVDVFYSANLVFHYQLASNFNPTNFSTTDGDVSLDADDANTAAKTIDENADGLWFGFDGVTNRIFVVNRSNADINMTVTSTHEGISLNEADGTATINLYLNGDKFSDTVDNTDPEHPVTTKYAYENRLLDVTSAKSVTNSEAPYAAGSALYDTTEQIYTSNMAELLKYSQAFSTKDGDADGGRFSACPEEDDAEAGYTGVTVTPAVQSGVDSTNSVAIAKHSIDGSSHHNLGYALVYFDISGNPFNANTAESGMAEYDRANPSYENATAIGTITLTFNSLS